MPRSVFLHAGAILLLCAATNVLASGNSCDYSLAYENEDLAAEYGIWDVADLRADKVRKLVVVTDTGHVSREIHFGRSGEILLARDPVTGKLIQSIYRLDFPRHLPWIVREDRYERTYHRDKDGNRTGVTSTVNGKKERTDYIVRSQGNSVIFQSAPGADVYWKRIYTEGRLTGWERKGMQVHNLEGPIDGQTSPLERVLCEVTDLEDGKTAVSEVDYSGGKRLTTAWTIRDSKGAPVRGWILATHPEVRAKGLGREWSKRYFDLDANGNGTSVEECSFQSRKDTPDHCFVSNRELTYY